jgi:hypothetical protein
LAVAGLIFKYFVTTFKIPFHKAFSRDKILGLHIACWENLTEFALICTECVNSAMSMCLGVVGCWPCQGELRGAGQGPAHDWTDTAVE